MPTEIGGSKRVTVWSGSRAGLDGAVTASNVGIRRARRGAVAMVSCALLLVVLSMTTFAATASKTFEWGQPVAHGGPGISPTRVDATGETAIDAGNASDLAIMPGGTVEGWGMTTVSSPSMTPLPIPNLRNVVQVADGD